VVYCSAFAGEALADPEPSGAHLDFGREGFNQGEVKSENSSVHIRDLYEIILCLPVWGGHAVLSAVRAGVVFQKLVHVTNGLESG
jgi:hypothetical protein